MIFVFVVCEGVACELAPVDSELILSFLVLFCFNALSSPSSFSCLKCFSFVVKSFFTSSFR